MTVLLLLATLVLGIGIAVPSLFPRLPIGARALTRVVVLVLLTILVARIVGSPIEPKLRDGTGSIKLWQQLVVVGWWIGAARGVTGVARLLLSWQNRSRETQILSDLIGAGIYAATVLAVIDIVFAVPVGGLIATSGIIAVVIGLALQSTLADVFSGIAIDIERPYRAGDLLWVEGGIEGQVREVNWRSTLVTTGNGDVAVVPNSVMAKSRLINHSMPGPTRRASIEVRLDPRVMPERCRAVLDAAIQACLLPLASPAPAVNLTALHGDGATYEISYSVPSSDTLGATRSELIGQVQRHLHHAAIAVTVAGVAEVPVVAVPAAADLLAASTVFGSLAESDRHLLAAEMAEVVLEAGIELLQQGAPVEVLYLLAGGTVGIRRRQPDGGELVRRMSPGSSLGVVGLVTGSPSAVTATALTPVKAFRLEKAGLARAIKAQPALATTLETLAERMVAAIREDLTPEEESHTEHPDVLLTRMRAFLRLLTREPVRGEV